MQNCAWILLRRWLPHRHCIARPVSSRFRHTETPIFRARGFMPSLYPADRSRLLTLFTTWPFVLALVLLLVNDGLLKQAYPGILTGKLSDFAGLVVVALPLFAAFPRHARAIYLAIGGAFLWWKSPASGAFISYMNETLPMNIGRT